ncbi:hypothetical protein N7541_005042 [Penicillium brevicompactum]|uniref:Wax synthase domain-containing protein n=1 Tax=Penicillium brevicompactum TaxID=5074 RepID=A0A9W9REL1_PENBR|nr:hypothetical protein N7541_005042 [Penicillium brevicompactum]
MRRPFTSVSNYIARNVLNLPRSSILERYTNLFTVFFISAVFHVVVDILQSIPMEKSGLMSFYLAFVLGIMLEDGVQEVWKRTGCPDASREAMVHHSTNIMSFWKRAIGFIWVTIWLGATSTWYFAPMTQSATGDLHMVPLSVANHLGLEQLVGVILIYGAVIAFIFEVEI